MVRRILVALLLLLLLVVIIAMTGLLGLGKRIHAPGLDALMSRLFEDTTGRGISPDTTLPWNIEGIAGTWTGVSDTDGTKWQFTFEKNFAVRASSSSGYSSQGTAFVHWKLGLTDGAVRVPRGWAPLDVDVIDSTEPAHRNKTSLGAFSLRGTVLNYCFSEPGRLSRPISDISGEGIRCLELVRGVAAAKDIPSAKAVPGPLRRSEARPKASASGKRSLTVTGFHADLAIQPDGEVRVRETIRIHTDGVTVVRKEGPLLSGIYRVIGGRLQGQHAYYRLTGFEMLGATFDGRPVPYSVRTSGRWFMKYVFLGPGHFVLTPGSHEFTVDYRVDRHVKFLPEHDELFWWVFGSGMQGWADSIGLVGVTATLPAGSSGIIASLDDHSWNAGTGKIPQLLKEAASRDANVLHYERRLSEKRTYLSVVVSMPKGAVRPPDLDRRAIFFLRDMSAYWPGLLGLTIFFGYYIFAWVRVGRDPEASSIVPRYRPPAGCSPGIARRLITMGYDQTAFSAALLNLTAEGVVRLTSQSGRYFIERTKKPAEGLAEDEAALLDALCKSGPVAGKRQELDAITIHRGHRAHRRALRGIINRKFFSWNLLFVIPAVVISLGVAAVNAEIVDVDRSYINGVIALGLCSLAAGFMTRLLVRKKALELRKPSKLIYLAAFFPLALYASAIMVSEGVEVFNVMKFMFLAPLFVMMTGHAIFFFLLRAPTELGRKALDEIEGFRVYLARAEGDRLDRMNPPEKTPSLMQEYMPYALALGVENRWAEQFTGVVDETYTLPPLDLFLAAITRSVRKKG